MPHSVFEFIFDGLLYKLSQYSDFVIPVLLEVKTVVFSLPELVVVVIKSFLCESNLISSTFEGVNSFSILVYHLVKLSPVINILHSLANGSFFDFSFGLGLVRNLAAFSFLIFSGDISVANLDGAVEKQFIFEIDYLNKGEKSHMHIDFSDHIQVEKIAVIEIETFIRREVPLAVMVRKACDILIYLEWGR